MSKLNNNDYLHFFIQNSVLDIGYFLFLTNKCPGRDSNPETLWVLPPEDSASTNFATWA